jgi:uncharacterized protein YchJ
MDGKSTQLPWEALQHAEGDIPWPALYNFAAAIVADPLVVDKLIDLYEQAVDSDYGQEHYEEFYIPAIFALAAPQLSDERRSEIGAFLVQKLAEAGHNDGDLLMEVLVAACGSMGPVVLPTVLETIAKELDHRGAWFHLWGLMELAAKTEDSELRNRVIQACVELLQQADRGEIEPIDAIDAAWTLALMGCRDCAVLLGRLKKKSPKCFGRADYAEALQLLKGHLDYTPLPNLWEMPVKEWLEPRWKMAKQWYEEHQGSNYEDDDFEAGDRRAMLLAERFMQSQHAQGLAGELFEDAGFITYNLLQYAWVYAGAAPEELNEAVLDQVLLEVFPRKITADRELFEKVAPVTEALLRWLESEGVLSDTTALVETVHSWAEAIVAEGMDSRNWGMGKSFMMQAMADGVNIEDQEAMRIYMAEYSLRQLMRKKYSDLPDPEGSSPPIPIVEHSPKIGRNEPCPCGSGKKYKKCCGRVDSHLGMYDS